jgi:rfaE bifunctional protein nucleotidyltransferase chain/domain
MHQGEVVDAERLSAIRDQMDETGRRLVLTNGCFDILHAGHVRYLQQARKLGDALAVALNSDQSVRALKGEGRPINCESDRAEVLAALGCVDYVVVFEGKRATGLLGAVRPHVYAKGGDYTRDSLDAGERQALEDAGAEIVILPLVPGRSTTSVLEKIKQS